MDAKEILKRYVAGERNFANVNLQGQSLIGVDLTGADFRHADIRGSNFTNTTLINANFSYAKGGLQVHQIVLVMAVALLLLTLSGVGAAQVGVIAMSTLSYRFTLEFSFLPAVIIFIALAVFLIVTLWQGLLQGMLALIVTLSITISISGTLAPILAGTGPVSLAVAWAVFGSLCTAIAVGVVRAVAVTRLLIGAMMSAGAFASLGAGLITWSIAKAVTEAGEGAVAKSLTIAGDGYFLEQVVAFVIAAGVILLGSYIGWQSGAGDEKFAFPWSITVALAATKGTCFYGANLQDANFTKATLRNTDLREAILTRTFWFLTENLDCARIGKSYLRDIKLRKLVTTGNGQGQNFERLNLEGLNLYGANLMNASFVSANLNFASLQQANLTEAHLVQTQLEQTDFTGACLTGACIQDWGITATTKLDRVQCKYVYMRVSTKDNPDRYRKPDNTNQEFNDGEFTDFIAPLVKTLDLYHNQNVNPRAILVALKDLVENHSEAEIKVMSMEIKEKDKFLLRLKTQPGCDLGELSQEYFETYNWFRALHGHPSELLVSENNDNKSRALETMILGWSNLHQKYKLVRDYVRDLSNFSEANKQTLKEIFNSLLITLEADTNLPLNYKADILDQLIIIAKVGNYPENWSKQQMKTAIRILKGMVTMFPSVSSNITKEINNMLWEIGHIFNLE